MRLAYPLHSCWIALAGLTLLVCGPAQQASASCGDYVHILSTQPSPLSSGVDTPSAPRKPCDGPACRQSPHTPPAPVPVTVETQHPDAVLMVDVESDPLVIHLLTVENLGADSAPREPIFHPPR